MNLDAIHRKIFGESCKDVAPLDTMSSSARKLEASPRGIHWIPFPIDDKAGWNRFKAVLPLVQPVNCQHGPALSADKPVWLPTIPFPQYVAYSDLSESKAYWIVKMIAESFDEYKDITPAMVWHDPKEAIKANSVLPYHPGAVRYFKEAGLWNAQLEKNQAELLARQAALKNLWDQVTDEALTKGVKAKEFKAFWMKGRAKKFPEFWVQTSAE